MGRKESSEVEYVELKRAIEIFYRQTMGWWFLTREGGNAFNLSGFCYCLGNMSGLLMKCRALTHALGC